MRKKLYTEREKSQHSNQMPFRIYIHKLRIFWREKQNKTKQMKATIHLHQLHRRIRQTGRIPKLSHVRTVIVVSFIKYHNFNFSVFHFVRRLSIRVILHTLPCNFKSDNAFNRFAFNFR